MWIKCQRITAAGREPTQAFGSRSSCFQRPSYIAYCLWSEGLAHKSLFFLPSLSLFLSKMNLKELTENLTLPEERESGEAPVGTTTYMDWSVLSLMILAFFRNYFLPDKFPEIVHKGGKHLSLHSSEQEGRAGKHQLRVTKCDSNGKPESSVPLARPEKSQRKLRNQFKQVCFFILRTCRSIHIDYLNIANYAFFSWRTAATNMCLASLKLPHNSS